MVFCCRELLFSKLFYRHQQQQPPPPVLRAAAGNRICRSVDKCCLSRFPDDTLGSFFAWFWTLLVLPSHGVLLPGAAFFEAVFPASAAAAVATSPASSCKQQNLLQSHFLSVSEVTLGIFEVQFWGFSVLQRHSVLLPGGDFFHGVFPFGNQVCSHLGNGCKR